MAKLNVKIPAPKILTHEGSPAVRINAEQQLRRVVMASMLWEDQFYIDGELSAQIIAETVRTVDAAKVAEIAIEAREKQKLRHIPLFLVRELARRSSVPKNCPKCGHRLIDGVCRMNMPYQGCGYRAAAGGDVAVGLVSKTLERVIQRPDELAELLAIYWQDGKIPLAAQVKKGLAKAFRKFDAYQLAKYDREGAIKLRDVLFMVHAKPDGRVKKNDADGEFRTAAESKLLPANKYRGVAVRHAEGQGAVWQKLAAKQLESPDTWEVALSATKSAEGKREQWARLLSEGKLGALALIRNLRNMLAAGIDEGAIRTALGSMKVDRVLPFRFIAAAKAAPRLEDSLEAAMLKCLGEAEKLPGKTSLLVDVSTSMHAAVSGKSDVTRMDAAIGVAMLLREIAERPRIFAFNRGQAEIPPRHGFGLRDAIVSAQRQMPDGTYIGEAVRFAVQSAPDYDRMIIVTDEQSHDTVTLVGDSRQKHYVINVGAYQNGIGYGKWHHIDGWSEAVIDYIRAVEAPHA